MNKGDFRNKFKQVWQNRLLGWVDKQISVFTCKFVSVLMDEVPGKMAASGISQSDLHGNSNECAQCAESGRIVSAAGFCLTCSDYLCTTCISQHKSIKALRDHEFQEDENKIDQNPVRSEVEKCAVHSDRPIEAYCAEDNTLGCALCLLGGHKTCQNKALISDLSRDVETSREFLDTQEAAEKILLLQDNYRQAIQQCLLMNDECHIKTLEGFKKFRTEILTMVETIGKKVHEEADNLKKENERQLKTLAEQIAKYSEDIKQHIMDIVDKKGRNEEQTFIALKKHGKPVVESVQHLETIHQDIAIKAFNFYYDPNIKQSLSDTSKITAETTPFLSVKCNKSVDNDSNICNQTLPSLATTCTSESQVNIKSHEDKYNCNVTSIINLSESKLILADRNNICLKLLDTTSNTITKRWAVTSRPWDITKVSESRLAVSFPDIKLIQFFKADQTLDPCESIKVSAPCYGLRCSVDRLIVSYTDLAQVQILDIAGTVLQTLQHDPSGNKLFQRPQYLTLSQDNQLIYVSDCINNTVTCMSTTGAVQWVYRDQQLNGSEGMATGDGGYLYISSWSNDTIHVVSSDGVRLAVIQLRQTGHHRAVCYISQNRTLYVSRWSFGGNDNTISRLRLQ